MYVRRLYDVTVLHHLGLGHQNVRVAVRAQALEHIVRDSALRGRTGEGQHNYVLIPVTYRQWLLQTHGLRLAGTCKTGFRPDDALHTLFGLYPIAAAARPSGAVMEAQFHSQALSLKGSPLEEFQPLGRQIPGRPLRVAVSHIEYLSLVVSGPTHSLQVGGNTFTGYVTVQPMPPCAGTTHSRTLVPLLKGLGRGSNTGAEQCCKEQYFLHNNN